MGPRQNFNLGHELSELRLSRRALLGRALAVGIATPAVAGLLAACGGDEDDTNTAASGGDPEDGEESGESPEATEDEDAEDPASTPADSKRGGQIRAGISGSPDSFDPHHQVQFDAIWINDMLYNRLTRIDHDMEVVPELARSWEPSEDGLRWTFQLREGVTFHNGKPFTGEDVKRSIERILDPEEGSSFKDQIGMIDSVDVISETEVALVLASPYADMPALLGNYFMRIVDVDAADTLQIEPVGTGPYKLKEHVAGERTVLERFEDFFDLENQAFADEIHYITVSEETGRLTALTGGDLHIVNEVTPSMIAMVENQPGVIVDTLVTGSYQVVCMNCQVEPFTDVRVRQALKLCADRSEFVQAVVQGYGEAGADHPVPSIDPMWADLGTPEQNIERAKELLTEAGYPDGLDLELHTTAGRAGLQEAALTMQEHAAAANIRIEVRNHPVDEYWADVWLNGNFYTSNWGARPLADNALSIAYLSDAEWNETFWQNERFDELVFLARETTDEAERKELYREAQQLLQEDGGALIPYFMSIIGAWSEQLKGFQIHPLRMVELNRAYLEG